MLSIIVLYCQMWEKKKTPFIINKDLKIYHTQVMILTNTALYLKPEQKDFSD